MPSRTTRSLLLSVVIAVVVYAALAQLGPTFLRKGASEASGPSVAQLLSGFPLWLWLAGLLLASLNYAFRFWRWQAYLRLLQIPPIPWTSSLLIFLAGFSLTVTPGKVGEVLKSYLLKQAYDVPIARTAPIVLAERLTDLIALLLLSLLGVATWMGASERWLLYIGFSLSACLLLVISSRRLAHGMIDLLGKILPGKVRERLVPKLHEFYDAAALLLGRGPLLWATGLSLLSWFCECLAFLVVVRGFPLSGEGPGLLLCTFIYATMTVAGALAFFVPGGLGVTESGMALMLSRLGHTTEGVAVAATLVVRLVTLWFAVILGLLALFLFERRTHVRLPEKIDRLPTTG